MDLFEFEGKKLLASRGIPVPQSRLLCTADDPADIPYPFVLKAQTLTGGRGKAGGIQVCESDSDFQLHAKNILAMQIRGHAVYGLLAEEMAKPQKELYLSITLQGTGNKPVLIASAMGGMDIEEVAKTQPDEILRLELEPFVGIKGYQLSLIAGTLGVSDTGQLFDLVEKLYRAFLDLNAVLVEINPLGVVDGRLVALDAKVALDDCAAGKMRDLFADIAAGREKLAGYRPPHKENNTITFVPLDGEVGLISDGAGTGMLALDMVGDAGGRAASFCELGGITNAEVMHRAMELTLSPGHKVRSLLIVLIGGFNRMDDMAGGITRYLAEHRTDIPVFTRMCGTMEREGKALMRRAGLETYDDLAKTVALAVQAAGGGE